MNSHQLPTFGEIEETIETLRSEGKREVTTTEVIATYSGEFLSDRGIDLNSSWNVAFGRAISAYSESLGIAKCSGVFKVDGGDGLPTTTRPWRVLNLECDQGGGTGG